VTDCAEEPYRSGVGGERDNNIDSHGRRCLCAKPCGSAQAASEGVLEQAAQAAPAASWSGWQ